LLRMTKKIRVPRDECIFDQDGYKRRAAAVCVRDDSEKEVLLVSSLTKPDSWIVPAGKVQAGEEGGECAMREAMEEGGVRGRLGRHLGTYEEHQATQSRAPGEPVKKRTSVYVLYVERLDEDYQERESRTRQWFPISEALKLLGGYKAHQAEYLRALQKSRDSLVNNTCLKSALAGVDNSVEKPPPNPLIQFIQGVSNKETSL